MSARLHFILLVTLALCAGPTDALARKRAKQMPPIEAPELIRQTLHAPDEAVAFERFEDYLEGIRGALDMTPGGAALGEGLRSADPLVRVRALWMLERIARKHARYRRYDMIPPEYVYDPLIARLTTDAAAAIRRLDSQDPRQVRLASEAVEWMLRGGVHLELRKTAPLVDALAALHRAGGRPNLGREAMLRIRIGEDAAFRTREFAQPFEAGVPETALQARITACAERIRDQDGPMLLRSAEDVCTDLLDALQCAPITCESLILGYAAALERFPLNLRRLHLVIALLEQALPDLPSEVTDQLRAHAIVSCGDAFVEEEFCKPVALGLVADGLLTKPEAALLMDANQLAWALVDRPVWLTWP